MRSRFLIECTTPEIDAYLAAGGRTALLPVGCTEMHGPHQPIGTDTLVAKAFALRLAEATDGVVLPEIHYTWAGSTDGFAGTISVEQELLRTLLSQIALKVRRMGFTRIVVLSIHGPNHLLINMFVREIFEKHRIPVVFVDPYHALSPESAALFEGAAGECKEASIVLAAMRILGKGDLYSEAQMRYADEVPTMPASLGRIRPAFVGYFMQDPRQHACPSEHVSLDRGLRFFDLQMPALVRIIEAIDDYAVDIEAQENKGWWQVE